MNQQLQNKKFLQIAPLKKRKLEKWVKICQNDNAIVGDLECSYSCLNDDVLHAF